VKTIREYVAAASDRLRDAGIETAANLDARLLAQHVLGWETARLLTSAGEVPPDAFPAAFDALVARRAAREPLAYITGHKEFWNLQFEVTPAVLIPRPETELIVEAVLRLAPDADAPLAVADVGTGSGCVAVAIAHERPRAEVLAIDISEAALAVARRNASRHHVGSRVRFAAGDLLDGISGPFDAIVANPPYVRSGDRNGLQPEVREEPAVALYSGVEGLDAIARLIEQAPDRMRRGAHLIFEFGLGQELDIERLLAASGQLVLVELLRDLQGIARTAVARRPD